MRRREVRVGAEPWARVADSLEAAERQLGCSPGWLVGDEFDVPCTVFLTDRRLLLLTQPWMLGDGARLFESPLATVQRCAIGSAGPRRTRLVYMAEREGTPLGIEGFAIDLPPGGRGRKFGELVVDTVGRP